MVVTESRIELMTAIANVVIAIFTGVVAWITYRSFKISMLSTREQANATSLTIATDLALRLEDRFDSEKFHLLRSSAAAALISKTNQRVAEDVFDFFETLGYLEKSGALDIDIVYSFFFHWINLYWRAGEEHIRQRRLDSSSLWEDFERIYQKVLVSERFKDPNSSDIHLDEAALGRYLQDEVDLTTAQT